ncbi:MAG TPA: isoprenylcysteine carboxylmethyltransferase family protein [Candidatus Limnocylindrales bacterium]|nr:isoprenylcysteine carboxylmethyltransferase family protein [Candidatus Limnocylindrales bacterium]
MIAAGIALRPASGPYAILLAVTAVVWLVLEVRQGMTRRPEAIKADEGSLTALRAAYVAGFLVAVAIAQSVPAAMIQLHVAAWIGLILMWCGIGLRFWSFRTLGRYFTFTVQTSGDQPVITGGPYRLVRHPGYLGLLLTLIGVGFFFGNWLALIALTVLVIAGLVYRINVEERAMMQTLGERYSPYASTHKRLIPLVW